MKIEMRAGQTLIEALVALAAILVVIAAIAILIIGSVNNSTFIKNQNQANKYAQQGMEYVRYIRNSNSAKFKNYSGIYCMGEDNSGSPTIGGQCLLDTVNLANTYIRKVEFERNSPSCRNSETKVDVTVSWSSGKCGTSGTPSRFCHKAELVSCMRDEAGTAPSL